MCARANRSSDNCNGIRSIPRRQNHVTSHHHVNEFIEQQLSSYSRRSRAFATAAVGDTSTSIPSSSQRTNTTSSGSLFLSQERDFVGSTRRQENRETSRRRLLRVLDEVLDIVQDE